MPITRVYDATALDWLGVPVWAAVTPLALDLTVHAGRGPTHEAARISAVMEAIERVSAERVDPARVRAGTTAQLGGIDPELFDLPFETSYSPDRPLDWIEGYDLLSGRSAWVPLDLVLSPAREGICVGVETNGLAAGNDHLEATLHALLELIERDALANERFRQLYADEPPRLRVIDRASVAAAPSLWLRVLRDSGMPLLLHDLTHDIGVPVFRARLIDTHFPGREGRATTFDGMGADLDASAALSRAVLEACQSHTVMVLGARDCVEGGDEQGQQGDVAAFMRRLLAPTVSCQFEPGVPPPARLEARLTILLECLATAGLDHCVVVDLTRPEFGVPVVRVLVPGLAGPYGDTTRRPSARLLRTLA